MDLDTLLKQHFEDLEKINNERKVWLWASSIVFLGIILLIFGWEWLSGLENTAVWWLIISLMLVISVNWWYWTMRVVRIIIHYQKIEYQLIKEIYENINLVKMEIKDAYRSLIKRP